MSDNINVAMDIPDLPHDVLTQVFQLLDRHPTSLAKCCCTCRTWRTLASDDEVLISLYVRMCSSHGWGPNERVQSACNQSMSWLAQRRCLRADMA